MQLSDCLGHLTYSTLVHPGDSWSEMRDSLTAYVPEVKRRVCPDALFGVSLRLSGASAATLTADPGQRAWLRDFLAAEGLYVFTVNAFPYGPFKGRTVMEQVYEPDWSSQDRVRYTRQVADILAEITGPEISPSIQSAPLAFRSKVSGPEDVRLLSQNLLLVVAHLVDLERRTGRRVKLALEPEPFCFLETTEETVGYFESHVYSAEATRTLIGLTGLPAGEVHSAVRRHLGVVFDIGHQSVQFEDIGAALGLLVAHGIPIFKLQAASALWVPAVTADAVTEIETFTNTIYLSQTTELRDGELTRFLNLADAIRAWRAAPDDGERQWRTHFHLPIFLDDLGLFRTTRSGIETALAMHAVSPLSDHLEIETYTWDVLPSRLKTGDVTDYVSRELEWLRSALRGGNPTHAARSAARTEPQPPG
jgi:hypothetical protein